MSGSAATRDPRRTRTRGLALGLGAVVVLGGGVAAVDVARAPAAAAASLTPFASCEELAGWYREAALARVTAWAGGVDAYAVAEAGGGGEDSSADGGPAAAPVPAAAADEAVGGAVGSSGTGTNVQEDGVDEPSRVKLAGGVAYTLVDQRLVLVDVAAGRVLGEVAVGPGGGEHWASELLLLGDRVVVLGSASLPVPTAGAAAPAAGDVSIEPGIMPYWGPPTTTMTTVDVSDPASPRVLDRAEVEGGYVSARASAGVVRVVTTSTPVLPFVDPWTVQHEALGQSSEQPGEPSAEQSVDPFVQPDESHEQAALERNRQVVLDATVADWLPDLVERDADGTVTSTSPVGCDTVAHPGEGAGSGTLTVLTLDPAAGEPVLGTTSVSADGSVVYASTDRLYVATTSGGWSWREAGGDGRVSTQLHGFSTTDATTGYLGSGSVDGWLLGSWAMDAHDGHLRVGTTSQGAAAAVAGDVAPDQPGILPSAGPGSTSSSVVVLRETPDGLVETGRVDGLGPGEQIRSLRWSDDLAVVVTFRQTDPLYTVDLGDPAAPRVLGELKVTGYSGYLHPVGDGIMLGVGQAGDEQGTMLGAKVETYDLRDLAAPRAVDDLVWPSTSSPVEWDSRLFAYLPASRVAVLPLEHSDPVTGAWSSGLVAVGVDEAGAVTETGRWDGGGQGHTGAVATDGEVLLAQRERWEVSPDGRSDAPRRSLVVLGATDLSPRAEVDLG